jgi:hypothetical protein
MKRPKPDPEDTELMDLYEDYGSTTFEDLYTDGLGHCFSDADPGL